MGCTISSVARTPGKEAMARMAAMKNEDILNILKVGGVPGSVQWVKPVQYTVVVLMQLTRAMNMNCLAVLVESKTAPSKQ